MKRKLLVIAFLMVATGTCRIARADPDASVMLEKLFTRLTMVRQDADRLRINDSINAIIDSYARSDSAFTHKFEGLRYLGQITSKNSQLKIITWNLVLGGSGGKYFCYFIHNTGKKNQVYRLESDFDNDPPIVNKQYNANDWYGALYYDFRQYGKGAQQYWVLLGLDLANPDITRKVIDVISFTSDGEVIFGKNIFSSGKSTRHRVLLEYSSKAVVTLRFNNDKSIVFDHLVPVAASLTGKRENYGPDFSLDAYNLEKGIWTLEENVDIRNPKK